MAKLGAEDENSESGGDDMSVDEGEAISEAVDLSMQCFGSLSSPSAVLEAFDAVKAQVKTLLFTAQVGETFGRVIESGETDFVPFLPFELGKLKKLFSRCTIISHEVFKDREWVLGPRKDVCGATTSIALSGPEGVHVPLLLTYYFQEDEKEGFVEEFSLAIDGDDEDGEMGSEDEDLLDDEDEDEEDAEEEQAAKGAKHGGGGGSGQGGAAAQKGGGASGKGQKKGAAAALEEEEEEEEDGDEVDGEDGSDDGEEEEPEEVVLVLEGKRTQRGSEMLIKEEVMEEIERVLQSGLALQTLLRFILLVTRSECSKAMSKIASLANGYDEEEDAMFMRKYLCAIAMPGHQPTVKPPAAGGIAAREPCANNSRSARCTGTSFAIAAEWWRMLSASPSARPPLLPALHGPATPCPRLWRIEVAMAGRSVFPCTPGIAAPPTSLLPCRCEFPSPCREDDSKLEERYTPPSTSCAI
ncbi:hypothetical protein T484DRAFT_2021102 [Baffinella frigidus]|nr:hypothetical protein T484DRAFT_2021102 [Cryptophyta sp. CCMP2293]